jgi:Sulfotransferase family
MQGDIDEDEDRPGDGANQRCGRMTGEVHVDDDRTTAPDQLLQALATEASGSRPTRPVLIGGVARSGTTLLGTLLGAGPGVLTVPEARFKWKLLPLVEDGTLDLQRAVDRLDDDWKFRLWNVRLPAQVTPQRVPYAMLLGAIVRLHAQSLGAASEPVWIDHTPGNLGVAKSLAGLLPDARFVHVVRDGRAAGGSILPLDWGPNDIISAAQLWAARIGVCLAAVEWLGPERACTVSYEDLVRQPAATLQRLRTFLDLPDPSEDPSTTADAPRGNAAYQIHAYTARQHALVTQPPDPSRAEAWRHQLTPRQIEAFEAYTGELLSYLGYDLMYGAAARPLPGWRRVTELGASYARRLTKDRIRRHRRRLTLEDA